MSSTPVAREGVAPARPPQTPLLRERLSRLRELCAGLADSMDENATQLESTGIPPADAFLDDLLLFRRQVAELLHLVRPDEAPLGTFAQIEDSLREHEQADRCVAALDRFLSLKGAAGAAADQLIAEQQRAAEFRQQVWLGTAQRSTTHELAENRHPWCHLVSLVTESEGLDDERWNQLSASVLSHLGPSIATAAARGRIEMESADSVAPEEAGSQRETTAEMAAIGSVVAHSDYGDRSGSASPAPVFGQGENSDSVFDDDASITRSLPLSSTSVATLPAEAVPQSSTAPVTLPAAMTAEARQAAAVSISPGLESSDSDARSRVASLAKIALGATDRARCAWISELILELIVAGRPGLAYHLARCLEERRSRTCAPIPSSLIRVWTIGQGVLFPRGELAALLEADLLNLASRTQASTDETWSTVLSLLARAAVLRPAIVAPATRAANWLRSLPPGWDAREGLGRAGSQLYNYCSRVSSDSEKLGGVRMGLVRRGTDGATLEALRDELTADIRRWLAEPLPAPLRYDSTTPLFLKAHWTLKAPAPSSERLRWADWQRAARTVDAIVSEILGDRRHEAPRLRAEMDRISHDLLPSLSSGDRNPGLHSGEVGDEQATELRDRLLQALSFGQRWLAIVATPTQDASGFIPQAAEDLFREVRERHVPVLEELRLFQSRTASRPVRTAAAVLSLAVKNVRQLIESELSGGTAEPDPRHLLHAELLKIPTLRLDAAWEPELDRERLEDEILRSLTGPDIDWDTAFQTRITIDDHDSAARILSLADWSVNERKRLHRQLDEIRSLRAAGGRWIENGEEGTVESPGHSQKTSTQEHSGLLTRLERLRTILQTDLDAAAAPSTRPAPQVAPTNTASVTPQPVLEEGSPFVFD